MSSWLTGRREFLIRMLEGGLLLLAGTLTDAHPTFAGVTPSGTGIRTSADVITIHHPRATSAGKGLDNADLEAAAVNEMVNAGILAFTGERDLVRAWRKIIPDPTQKVAIKINCQIRGIYTKAKVVQPLVDGLMASGVPADNIIIYDMTDNAFDLAGFTRTSGPGVKVGKVADFGGYGRFLFSRLANLLTGGYPSEWLNLIAKIERDSHFGAARYLATTLLRGRPRPWDCAYLINVPVLKALDSFSGVTLSMKNHYGSFANPSEHHDDIMDYIPHINSLPEIRKKTRLIVLDALFCEYKWKNSRDQSNISRLNRLLISNDPVAIDTLGWLMIEEERRRHGLGPVDPQPAFIIKAAAMGLGIADQKRIKTKQVNLGA